jgi:outer membrane protein assembly factor BamB
MMDKSSDIDRESRRRTSARFAFTVWLGFAVLAAIGLLLLRWFGPWLADHQFPSMESGALNLSTYVLVIVLWIWGTILLIQFGGRSRRARWTRAGLFVLAGVAIPVLFEPVFDGGLGLRGLRPRLWGSPVSLGSGSGSADLTTESAADFPQFLGPNRNGTYAGIELSPDWTRQSPQVLWRQPIGQGWSSFAIRNGFAVTMQQVGELECVSCYRVDNGTLVWNYSIPRRHENILGGIGPRSTPTIYGGRVYAQGALGNVCCLDGATGKPLWEVDLLKLGQIPVAESINGRGERIQIEQSNLTWGRAASPLIWKDWVILPLSAQHTLVALDVESGSEVWRSRTGQPPSYSSPMVAEIHGQSQILVVNESTVTGHAAQDGTELWSHAHPGNSGGDANTSQATVLGENRVLLSKGYGLGGEVIEISQLESPREGSIDAGAANDRWRVATLWKSQQVLKTKLTNPVVRDGCAYAISNEVLECVDLSTGSRRWRAPERFGHGQVLLVGGHLLAHTEDGELILIDADPATYRERGRVKTISGVCWNTIAMFGDKVLVRSDIEAACLRLPTDSGNAMTARPLSDGQRPDDFATRE